MTPHATRPAPAPLRPGNFSPLAHALRDEIRRAGGWLGFDRFMELALYAPGLGYYSGGRRVLGQGPHDGSDFVTAPELSPLFGLTLARQIEQALEATGTDELWEFGAGSGALAVQLLGALGERVRRYTIVDLSGTLRERQHRRLVDELPEQAHKVVWADSLPDHLQGVIVGNEVLDAMPVRLLHWTGEAWQERGVALAAPDGPSHNAGGDEPAGAAGAPAAADQRPTAHGDAGEAPPIAFTWADRPTADHATTGKPRPPTEHPDQAFVPGTVVECHPQAEAFVATLAGHLTRGAAFFIDYGFPEHEFYLPQRTGGTLMCHHAHRSDPDPLSDVGHKDITTHVNFTGIALAAQEAGWEVLGYTSQARFLLNCGLLAHMAPADPAHPTVADFQASAAGQKLINEHEMGELFKVIGFVKGDWFDAVGFGTGDRTHTL